MKPAISAESVLASSGFVWNSTVNNNRDYHDSDYNESSCTYDVAIHEYLISRIFFGVLYTVVFVIAISGNFLVVYVVATNRVMQTVTNLFITNLAVSDFVVMISSLWVTPLYTYLGKWIWGAALCHAVPLFQGTSIFISSLTLTAIAVDRYIVILYPFKKRTSPAVCLAVISFVWLLSLMLVAPYAVHMTLINYDKCDIVICKEEWALKEIQIVYGIVVMTLQFGVPFLVITICYCRIWFYLKYRETTLGPRSDADLRRKRRMLKMLVSMVVIFALCWLPPNVVNIMKDNEDWVHSEWFVFMFLLAHVVSMTSSMWNPLLYAFLNDNFRREFMAVLPCFSTGARLRRAFSISRTGNSSGSTATRRQRSATIDASNGVACKPQNDSHQRHRLTVAEPDDFSTIAIVMQNTRRKMFQKSGQAVAAVALRYGRQQRGPESVPLNNNNNINNNNNEIIENCTMPSTTHLNGNRTANTDNGGEQDLR